ncbi:MFS transporter, partial [Escherichia coli]|nr:MFS transporter [Escherichia coli]
TTIFSLGLEALGLLFVGLSVNMYLSMFGAFLTGFGLSMVYPLLALPAIKNMPEENIGFAISLYESCFDIGILISGFLGGLIVSCFGLQYIFYFSFICCLIAIPLSVMAYQVSSTLNKECR